MNILNNVTLQIKHIFFSFKDEAFNPIAFNSTKRKHVDATIQSAFDHPQIKIGKILVKTDEKKLFMNHKRPRKHTDQLIINSTLCKQFLTNHRDL